MDSAARIRLVSDQTLVVRHGTKAGVGPVTLIALVIACVLRLLGAHHVTVVLGDEEHIGGKCFHRDVEVEVDGKWTESEAVRCAAND